VLDIEPLPLFSVALGLVVFGAQWIGGDPGSGLVSVGIMSAFGALVLFGGRAVHLARRDRRPRVPGGDRGVQGPRV